MRRFDFVKGPLNLSPKNGRQVLEDLCSVRPLLAFDDSSLWRGTVSTTISSNEWYGNWNISIDKSEWFVPQRKISGKSMEQFQCKILEKSDKLVIVFGWAGGEHKYVKKYSQIWNDRGCSTIQMTADMSISGPHGKPMDQYEKLVDSISELFDLGKLDKVFVHVFSNGGMFNLVNFMKVLDERGLGGWSKNLKSIIFDSCPGNGNPTAFALALSAYIKNPVIKWIFYWIIYFVILPLSIACSLGLMSDPVVTTGERVRDGKFLENAHVSFVYSTKDELIPFQCVEEYAESHERKGRKVVMVKLDSPHVQHLLKYRKVYEDHIDKVLSI